MLSTDSSQALVSVPWNPLLDYTKDQASTCETTGEGITVRRITTPAPPGSGSEKQLQQEVKAMDDTRSSLVLLVAAN